MIYFESVEERPFASGMVWTAHSAQHCNRQICTVDVVRLGVIINKLVRSSDVSSSCI